MTYNVEISILMVHMTTIYSSTTYKLLMAYKMVISSLMVHMITASLTSTYQPQSSNRRCILGARMAGSWRVKNTVASRAVAMASSSEGPSAAGTSGPMAA